MLTVARDAIAEALTLLRDVDRQTVTLQVVNLVAGRYSVEWNQVMAATLAATVPVGTILRIVLPRKSDTKMFPLLATPRP